MSDHRWQGYSHQELYDQIHQGPGPDGSTDSVRRWGELNRALGDIDTDLASALTAAMAGWQGVAAENARAGLRPLGEWAVQAQQAAQLMRDRAEQQADYVGKARADMPPPVPVRNEDPGTAVTMLTHLFGGQTDHEAEEARQNAAEQRAFEVMRTYESSTRANTTTLASFAPAPQVVVDSPPAVSGSGGSGGGQPVTISIRRAAPPTPAAGGAGRANTTGSGGAAAHRGGRVDGRGAGGAASPSGSRSGDGAPRHPVRPRRDAEPVDHRVIEDSRGTGGFFDDDRSSARPVIGGDPA
ncbi:PPE domain-containing protein [Parasphingorhabdus pacifica]